MKNPSDWLRPELIWFLAGIIMLLLEFALPGVIILFFGIGAILVALVCLLTDISLNAQLFLFLVSSVLLLACFRRWLKGIFIGHESAAQDAEVNLDEFLGERARVTRKIVPDREGRVEFRGTDWSAEADEEIAAGTAVEIVGKHNITLKVKPLERS